MYDWSGVYVGGTVGYGWGNWAGNVTKVCPTPPGGCTTAAFDFPGGTSLPLAAKGWLGGAELGFASQQDAFVWGIEGDISATGIKGSGIATTQDFPFPPGPATHQIFNKNIQVGIDWLGTIRGRLGVLVHPNVLLYGTGGLAVAGTSTHQDVFFNPGNAAPALHASDNASATKWGWVIGAGVEKRLDSHWSIKAEYLYANLGNVDYHYVGTHTGYPYGNPPGSVHDTDGFSTSLSVQVARIGINYKIGGGS